MKLRAEKLITVSLPADLAIRLEKLTLATGSDESAIIVAALHAYVEAEAARIQDVEDSILEADRGEFASDEEVNSFFAKYGG